MKFKQTIEEQLYDRLHDIYSEWLMDYTPEDIHGSDSLTYLEENQTYLPEFLKWVEEEL